MFNALVAAALFLTVVAYLVVVKRKYVKPDVLPIGSPKGSSSSEDEKKLIPHKPSVSYKKLKQQASKKGQVSGKDPTDAAFEHAFKTQVVDLDSIELDDTLTRQVLVFADA